MNIWVINGPNLNMLGLRQPDIYGHESYSDLVAFVEQSAREVGAEARCMQSNHEGELVTWIQQARDQADAIVINPAAYTHTSVAILDALLAAELPAIEVHLSDISVREDFRQVSYTGLACQKTIAGKGFAGYREAIKILINKE